MKLQDIAAGLWEELNMASVGVEPKDIGHIQEESRAVKVIQTKTAESTHFQKDFWNKSPWNTGQRRTGGHTDAVERQQSQDPRLGAVFITES